MDSSKSSASDASSSLHSSSPKSMKDTVSLAEIHGGLAWSLFLHRILLFDMTASSFGALFLGLGAGSDSHVSALL